MVVIDMVKKYALRKGKIFLMKLLIKRSLCSLPDLGQYIYMYMYAIKFVLIHSTISNANLNPGNCYKDSSLINIVSPITAKEGAKAPSNGQRSSL